MEVITVVFSPKDPLPHHRKLDFEDLIPKQPPLIPNAAWLLPEDFKNKHWKTYHTKRK